MNKSNETVDRQNFIDPSIAKQLPPDVMEAIYRIFNGGTESDAMFLTVTLSTTFIELADVYYKNCHGDVAGADKSTANDACSLTWFANLLDDLGYQMSANHARAVSKALFAMRTFNMIIGRGVMRDEAKRLSSVTKTYIVKSQSSGMIKIGKSINPDARIKSLGTSSGCKLDVLAIIDSDIECELHNRFSDIRVHGEWFIDDGRIFDFVNEVTV